MKSKQTHIDVHIIQKQTDIHCQQNGLTQINIKSQAGRQTDKKTKDKKTDRVPSQLTGLITFN